MKSNRLKLNSDKTQFMWLGSQTAVGEDRQKDHDELTIGEHSIESSTSAKNLCVTFDSELGMDLHVHNIDHSQLFLSVETAAIHLTITFHGCRESIGPFPHIKSCRLL